MKIEYDLSKRKARKNPYAAKLNKPTTTRLPMQTAAAHLKRKTDESKND